MEENYFVNVLQILDASVERGTWKEEGQFVADDKSTPDVNEAYTTVEVKKSGKRGRPKKKK